MGSRRISSRKILGVIARSDAERLLLDWANLPELPDYGPAELEAYMRLLSRHPQVFGHIEVSDARFQIEEIGVRLRQAWDAPNRRNRDWYCFQLRAKFHQWKTQVEFFRHHPPVHIDQVDIRVHEQLWKSLEEPPPISDFEAAIFYFQTSISDRAKYCGGPDCPAPYFIATKRWQKYCSLACAGPAGREAKRKWWHEHKGKGSL
jgi:hypothetical protein